MGEEGAQIPCLSRENGKAVISWGRPEYLVKSAYHHPAAPPPARSGGLSDSRRAAASFNAQDRAMLSEIRYRVNTPGVILETFADEVVIVNLESGNYFSIDKTGAEIWALLAEGASLPEIVSQLGRRYAAPQADIERALQAWMEQLLAEALLVPSAGGAAPDRAAIATLAPAERLPFEPPALQKYTDMQELLLLDPIHEVDETGWPNVKPAA
jgi:predicted Rdx family selenoprotein